MIYERHSKSHFALSFFPSSLPSLPFIPNLSFPPFRSLFHTDANNSPRTTLKQRFERELNPVSRIDYQSLNNFLLLPRRRIIDEYLRHWSPLIFDRSCEIKNLLLRAVLSPPHRDTRAFPRFQRFVLAFIESSPYSMNPEQRIPFSLSHLAIEDLLSPPCLSSAKLFLRFRPQFYHLESMISSPRTNCKSL